MRLIVPRRGAIPKKGPHFTGLFSRSEKKGVFCNGVKTFDGKDYVKHAKGPGHVLDRFNASAGGHTLLAAQ